MARVVGRYGGIIEVSDGFLKALRPLALDGWWFADDVHDSIECRHGVVSWDNEEYYPSPFFVWQRVSTEPRLNTRYRFATAIEAMLYLEAQRYAHSSEPINLEAVAEAEALLKGF